MTALEYATNAPAVPSLAPSAVGATQPFNGYALVWSEQAEIRSSREGHFLESFRRGSVAPLISSGKTTQTRLLVDHGSGHTGMLPIGRITSLMEDDHGLRVAGELFTESRAVQDLLPAIRANQYQLSIRFGVGRENYDPRPGKSTTNPRGLATREVVEVSSLPELSFTPVPAYKQTRVSLGRSEKTATVHRIVPKPQEIKPRQPARNTSKPLWGVKKEAGWRL
jgi:HK97 family phage prohead protease